MKRMLPDDAGTRLVNVPGVGYVTPETQSRETYAPDAAGTTRHKSGAKMPLKGDKRRVGL
jgi:hypothetical protein